MKKNLLQTAIEVVIGAMGTVATVLFIAWLIKILIKALI